MKEKGIDKIFLGIIISLVVVGIFVFLSASLGILAKNETKFYGVLFNQIVLGVGGGILAMFICSRIPYQNWRKFSLYFFIASILLTLAVWIPGLGFSHGGARRWLSLGPVSFQPAELLKISFVLFFAAWLSMVKQKASTIRYGILPFGIFTTICAAVLFIQPDTKSFLLIITAGIAMLFISGLPWKYIIGFFLIGIVGVAGLAMARPYVADRIRTYIDPSRDPSGSSYQLQQSLIAIGSGGVFGRGYGQSIQKFSYLPEPQGDSVFAVVGEEFGFVGSVTLLLLFVAFALRGLRIAYHAPNAYGRLLATGIVILLIAQSFLNIASIVGVFPLTGVPLVFISHGGTALMLSMAAIGIVLNISKYEKKGGKKEKIAE